MRHPIFPPSEELVNQVREEVLATGGGSLPGKEHVRQLVARSLVQLFPGLPKGDRESLINAIVHELAGLGPLEVLLQDTQITEIMANGPDAIFVEKAGVIQRVDVSFRNREHLEDIIQRIVANGGRRIDHSTPFVDTRLPDGSRVNVIIPPLAIEGPYLTIRKFSPAVLKPSDIVASGACSEAMMSFLEMAVKARCNLVVSGGTGSGKTTLLNALSTFIDGRERIITIEDSAELKLRQGHVLRLETRPANIEGKGEITIRMLLRNSLRMRPDRILIGEVRGAECFDLLHAWNTGHEGSMSTVHANSPPELLYRLAGMVMMAGERLPHETVVQQLLMVLDVIVQLKRFPDGRRRVTKITVLEGSDARDAFKDVFAYRGHGEEGIGQFVCLDEGVPKRISARISGGS